MVNQEFVVKPAYYYYLNCYFPSSIPYKINVHVEGGGIDFIVMDKLHFDDLNINLQRQDYYYNYNDEIKYEEISGLSITSIERTWTPPNDSTIYFVWYNNDLYSDRTVNAYFTYNETLVPSIAQIFAVILVFAGLMFLAFGFKRSEPTAIKINDVTYTSQLLLS